MMEFKLSCESYFIRQMVREFERDVIMKPLERIFFQACLMKRPGWTIRDVIFIFAVMGFSHKQLWYYLEKWSRKGFYDSGVSLDLGWFYSDSFTGEYKVMYEALRERKQNENQT